MPYKLMGDWQHGISFDLHTLASTYLGENEYGHPHFDNQRSEMGELVYRLKNKQDTSAVTGIVKLQRLQLTFYIARVRRGKYAY